ncbi:peptidoglycan-binding protein [Streptomyces sp. NPDC058001]|uniref:peptidoglycan-binding domain-containing protein n=1 Tax=Streptomyces sp. NPDC058001 TaxID=3346300 RepID=UPI0036EFA28F
MGSAPGGPLAQPPESPGPRSRRRRLALVAASGATVAVVGAAAFASGLFSYEKPRHEDTALPDTPRSAPDTAEPEPSSPSASARSSAPAPANPSPPAPSGTRSGSPSSSPSSSPSPNSSAPSTPSSPAPSTAKAGGSTAPQPPAPPAPDETLRRGDEGPEVQRLQERLRQLRLYSGRMNGVYSSRVEEAVARYQWARGIDEESGVYGPKTRRSLESETSYR